MADAKFQHGKIYTIRSNITPLIYVGSTRQRLLSSRMTGHRSKFKAYKNGEYGYCASFDILDIDENAYIELYERYPCDSKEELEKREGEVIRSLDCVNKRVAGRTKEEYREDNKEHIKQYKKQYYVNNKDEIAAKSKQYRENNKENIKTRAKEYYEDNKEQIKAKSKQYRTKNKDKISAREKEYRTKNKDKIAARKKQYYIENKDKISAREKEKFECECGSTIRCSDKARHMKSKKHREYMDFMYN